MSRDKKKIGLLAILIGVLVALSGVSVMVAYFTEAATMSWHGFLKGPVWLAMGGVLVLIGREFVDDARHDQ